MKKWLIVPIVILAFTSCDPVANFDTAQPAGGEELATFPSAIQGTYADSLPQSSLSISGDMLIQNYDITQKIAKDNLGENTILRNDTLIDTATNDKQAVIVEKDSLSIRYTGSDTLFATINPNVLKQSKGALYLNTYTADSSYSVLQLLVENKELQLRYIAEGEDVNNLKKITSTDGNHFAPSRRKFKKYLRHGGFAAVQYYTKK